MVYIWNSLNCLVEDKSTDCRGVFSEEGTSGNEGHKFNGRILLKGTIYNTLNS